MTLSRRLGLLERQAEAQETVMQCERLAKEFDVPFQKIWAETKRIRKELDEYERMGMTLEQALRAYAVGEGMDPDEMLEEFKRISAEYEENPELSPEGNVAE